MNPPVVEAAGGAHENSQAPPRRRFVCSFSSLCRGCLPEFLIDPYERQYFFLIVLRGTIWRFLMCCCILLLLFGSHIQNLWCDKAYDGVFDILYTIAFGMFCLDIALRSLVEPGYIGCNFASLRRQFSRWRKGRRRGGYDDDSFTKFYIGSFLFWCDIISTFTILYDISYINKMQTQEKTRDIVLNEFYIPVRCSWQHVVFVQSVSSLSSNLTLFATAMRLTVAFDRRKERLINEFSLQTKYSCWQPLEKVSVWFDLSAVLVLPAFSAR